MKILAIVGFFYVIMWFFACLLDPWQYSLIAQVSFKTTAIIGLISLGLTIVVDHFEKREDELDKKVYLNMKELRRKKREPLFLN